MDEEIEAALILVPLRLYPLVMLGPLLRTWKPHSKAQLPKEGSPRFESPRKVTCALTASARFSHLLQAGVRSLRRSLKMSFALVDGKLKAVVRF